MQLNITKLLKRFNQDLHLTIVLHTNNFELIKLLCRRVAIMDQGRIVEDTSVGDFYCTPKSKAAIEFIAEQARADLPWHQQRRLVSAANNDRPNPVIRLVATSACESIEDLFNAILAKNEMQINIIQAYREHVQDDDFNVIIAELFGAKEAVNSSIQYLQEQQIAVQVIGYVNSFI